MRKNLFYSLLLISLALSGFSQSHTWQWVRGGGSKGAPVSSNLEEDCHWLGTDQAGNIYGMSMIFYSSIQIDTSYMAYGFGFDDFAVFSYTCEGNFRWARYFGGAVLDLAWCMCTDKDGNTYVGGGVVPYMNSPTHYGDSTCPAGTPGVTAKILMKLDSAGHTIWINFIPATAPLNLAFCDARQDSYGNICILGGTDYPGTWGSFTFPSRGFYVLKFDRDDGNLFEVTKLDLVGRIHGPVFSLDADNNYYICWAMGYQDTVAVGNDTLAPGKNDNLGGLAKFDTAGTVQWLQYACGDNSLHQGKFMYGRPALKGDNVFLPGEAQDSVSFFGTVVTNPNGVIQWVPVPLVASFRQDNGNFIRLKQLYPHYLCYFTEITTTVNGIALAGLTGSVPTIYNLSDTIKPMSTFNTAYPFLMEIDTGLSWFSWAMATRVNNASSRIMSMITDMDGNIYAGGFFSDSLYPSSGPGIRKHGGPNDFFIGKISANPHCGCILATPEPLVMEMSGYTIGVTGSATGQLDSLYWDWGDGTVSHYLNQNTLITHTYATGGNYSLCLRAYNYCGVSDSCLIITGVGINEPFALPLNIYPNPVTSAVYIENPALLPLTVILYSVQGQKLQILKGSGPVLHLNMEAYSSGAYLLELQLSDGRKSMRKVLKE